LQTGVLNKLWVSEGEVVKRGQLLASIEPDRQQAAVDDGLMRSANLKLSIERLHAELYGVPLKFDPKLVKKFPEIALAQRRLYERRQQAMQDEIASLTQALHLAQEELRMNEALLKSGDISKSDLIRLQRQTLDINSQIINRKNRFTQEAQTELARLETEYETQNRSQVERDVNLAHSEIRSPVAGIINTVHSYTIGSVIREGEQVMQILPTDGQIVVEAKLSPTDVSQVHVGQEAWVKLDAFDYTVYGELKAKVSYISSDAITESSIRGEMAFYRVRIEIAKDELTGRQKEIALRPGMTATVDVKSGNRTVLSYLIKPISKMMHESLNEK
jgi:membrane fusion protein, adhesin transport system